MSTFNVSEIVDKTLIAKKAVDVFSDARLENKIKTVHSGDTIGVVYSYLNDDVNGGIIWMIDPGGNKPFQYVKHDGSKLKEPVSAKSEEEKVQDEEEANKTLTEKIRGDAKHLITVGVVVFAGAGILKAFLTKTTTQKATQ